jgi:hypothetical protein
VPIKPVAKIWMDGKLVDWEDATVQRRNDAESINRPRALGPRPSSPSALGRIPGRSPISTNLSNRCRRIQALGEEKAQESVDEEFSFVQTVRHLVFAMEKWFNAPILGESFHPMGLPNTGSLDFPWPGLDYSVKPSLAEALAVRADRAAKFRAYLANVDAADFPREVEVLENGKATVLDCVQTVMEEEFWHNRYALRDLAVLEQTK